MCREDGVRKREDRGGAAVAMAVTSGVRERTGPFPRARARACTHRDMHTRAHRSPSDTLEGKVKLKARERRGRRDPPPLPSPRAMTDAAEAAFLTPSPPSCCSRSFPCPRPSTPPHGARASPRPLPPRRSRRASGPGRATDGRGRWRVGAAAGGPFHRVTPDSFAQPLGESPPGECGGEGEDVKRGQGRAEPPADPSRGR